MPSALSRKDFLRSGGVGLTSVALLGAAGCVRRLGGNRDVVKFLTGTEETTIQERAVTEIQVNRFEEQHPKYALEREAIDPDAMSKVIPSRLRSDESPDVFSYNKDLVSAVPKTVGELRGIAEELKLRGTIPLALGNREQSPAGQMFSIA